MKILNIRNCISIGVLAILFSTSVYAAETLLECDFKAQKKAGRAPGPAMIAPVIEALTPIPLNAVQIGDKDIARKILVQSVNARRTQTNTVQVIVRMVNCTDYEQHVQLRSSFMDDAQVPVEPTSAWNTVFIPPRSMGVYTENSISTDAVAYFFAEMRESD